MRSFNYGAIRGEQLHDVADDMACKASLLPGGMGALLIEQNHSTVIAMQPIGDWNIGVSIVMGGLTYLLTPCQYF